MPCAQRDLTRADVTRYAAETCFQPTETARVGLELEFLTFHRGDRINRPHLTTVEDAVRGALPAGGRITFEPGGQLEVSTTPHATAAGAIAAAHADLAVITDRLDRVGIELLAVGCDQWRPARRVRDTARYRAMERWFDGTGPAGRRMMCNTAALQLNLDFGSATRLVQRWRTAHTLGPVLVAAFANSPARGWLSTRLATWFATDPHRTAPVEGEHPAAAWARYALRAEALMCATGPLPTPIAFGDWIDKGCALGFPDADDLAYHLTTLFPPVRPRGWLEVRYLDALPSPWWEAATTTLVTLLADAVIDDAYAASESVAGRWRDAAKVGLEDDDLAAAADACFALAVDASGDPAVEEYRTRYVARREPAWA